MPPSSSSRHRQESGCGCGAVLTRGLRGSCFRPAAAAAATPAGAAVKAGLVHDAGTYLIKIPAFVPRLVSFFFFWLVEICLFASANGQLLWDLARNSLFGHYCDDVTGMMVLFVEQKGIKHSFFDRAYWE
jgi:hypothetical protein